MSKETRPTLCYRCEYRARYLETGHGPRNECQQPEQSKCGCYMYTPTIPMVINADDDRLHRPAFGGMLFGGRSIAVRKADELVEKAIVLDGGVTLVYEKVETEDGIR